MADSGSDPEWEPEASSSGVRRPLPRGPYIDTEIDQYFTFIKQVGQVKYVKCNFCGFERTRAPLRLKQHLVQRCTGNVPLDIKQKFESLFAISGATPNGSESKIRTRGKKTTYKGIDSGSDDEDIPRGAVKAIADLIEEGVKTKTNKFRKTKDDMEHEEHDAKMRLMKAQTSLYSTQEKMYTLVGHGLTSFLSTFDDFLKRMKGKSMVVGGLAFQFGDQKGSSPHKRVTVDEEGGEDGDEVTPRKKQKL